MQADKRNCLLKIWAIEVIGIVVLLMATATASTDVRGGNKETIIVTITDADRFIGGMSARGGVT